MKRNRGQTILEYSILIIILLGVFVAMQDYVKRGIQGRWKMSVDDLADQYDPRLVNSSIIHTIETNSDTVISLRSGVLPDLTQGTWSNRVDTGSTIEKKSGYTAVGWKE